MHAHEPVVVLGLWCVRRRQAGVATADFKRCDTHRLAGGEIDAERLAGIAPIGQFSHHLVRVLTLVASNRHQLVTQVHTCVRIDTNDRQPLIDTQAPHPGDFVVIAPVVAGVDGKRQFPLLVTVRILECGRAKDGRTQHLFSHTQGTNIAQQLFVHLAPVVHGVFGCSASAQEKGHKPGEKTAHRNSHTSVQGSSAVQVAW